MRKQGRAMKWLPQTTAGDRLESSEDVAEVLEAGGIVILKLELV